MENIGQMQDEKAYEPIFYIYFTYHFPSRPNKANEIDSVVCIYTYSSF